ncbi:carbohydrate ABC transporter permease [Alicyclobacillus vulcanalis]|uniref:Carbohydrate ABC transporter membrane protein 1, CUT1 family n=1 Tax=Alicyclobacillus vulcanalis TaxID=252246 RepID=A0A1N7PG90_9BACL|nr:sugar ABC transporter permease [Alicyclobacillus vulcanalis]SIT09611.1 carbohydrate ABC transporter membrane protein 1, CUT1 family [Alicyclobacillus vulcanalis]
MVAKRLNPWVYLAPSLLIYIFIIIYPSVYTIIISLFKWNGISSRVFVGLRNYVYLFQSDPVFGVALRNTIIWTIMSVSLPVVLGLALALVLNQRFRGRTIYRSVFYFPYILSNIIVAVVWQWIYYPQQGLLDRLLAWFGAVSGSSSGWLGNPHTALYMVFLASLWQSTGGIMVLFLAGLQALPTEVYEAAAIEGASALRTLFAITIPLLKESFVVVISITLIGALKVFDIIYAMTNGGPAYGTEVLSTWMYTQTFMFNNYGIGAAISVVMMLIVGALAVPYVIYMSRD